MSTEGVKPIVVKQWFESHQPCDTPATCEHVDPETHQECGVIVTIVFPDVYGRTGDFLCTNHAQARIEAQAIKNGRISSEATKFHRFFLEFDGYTSKNRASRCQSFVERLAHSEGNVVALDLDPETGREIIASYSPTSYAAYVSIQSHANCAVSYDGVSREYLRDHCTRISLDEAYLVGHTQLFERMLSDYQRLMADVARGIL